jgi:hypothetical protein
MFENASPIEIAAFSMVTALLNFLSADNYLGEARVVGMLNELASEVDNDQAAELVRLVSRSLATGRKPIFSVIEGARDQAV